MTFFWIAFHVFFNALFGICVLLYQNQKEGKRPFLETLIAGSLLGWLLEVVLIAILIYARVPFKKACALSFFMIMVFIFVTAFLKKREIRFVFPQAKPWHWYEWLLLASVIEKLGFIVWQLTSVKIWGDDALTHWAGRGRCLYGEINWSLDPQSPIFLGHTSLAKNYPIATSIWRAVTAALNGSWNDVIARADSPLFFILVILAIWTIVYRFSKERYLAAGATFIVAALPFHVWHGMVGYIDIGVEAMLMGALIFYFREAWFLSGILIAGSAWMKNEGLLLYAPAFLLGMGAQWFPVWGQGNRLEKKAILKRFAWFIAGFLCLVFPRLFFNLATQQSFGPYDIRPTLPLHPEILRFLFDFVVMGPTHSVFWILVPLLFGICFSHLWADAKGRFMVTFLAAVILEVIVANSFTGAFEYLVNQSNIHRTMLQLYGYSIVALAYGVWLGTRKNACKK